MSGARVLRDVRQLVSHERRGLNPLATPEPDVVAVGNGARPQAGGEGLRERAGMNADLAEVEVEPGIVEVAEGLREGVTAFGERGCEVPAASGRRGGVWDRPLGSCRRAVTRHHALGQLVRLPFLGIPAGWAAAANARAARRRDCPSLAAASRARRPILRPSGRRREVVPPARGSVPGQPATFASRSFASMSFAVRPPSFTSLQ